MKKLKKGAVLERKVVSEESFRFQFENFFVVGTWDKVSEEEGGVVITELKSNLGKRTAEDNFQLMIYTLAYERVYGIRPSKAVLQCINTGASSVHIPDDNYLMKAHNTIIQTVNEIQKGVFKANPSKFTCRTCNWKATCPAANNSYNNQPSTYK